MTSFKITENLSLINEIQSFLSHPQHRKLEHIMVVSWAKNNQYHHILRRSLPQIHMYLNEINFLSKSQDDMNFIRSGPAPIYLL